MKLKYLKINNYRSIESLEWEGIGELNCLIGDGDSGKTSILEAIHLLLYPSYKFPFEETDFKDLNLDNPISIEGFFILDSDSPLLSENKYGLYLKGLKSDGKIRDEGPKDEDKKGIQVQLTCDESFEPKWTVVGPTQERGFSIKDRQLFQMLFIGSSVSQRDFSWSKGSPLLTDSTNYDDIKAAQLDIVRKAKEGALGSNKLENFEISDALTKELSRLGVKQATSTLSAGIDINAISANLNEISIHENNIPFRRKGLGSQRIFSIISQILNHKSGLVLIDELELGLDPGRLQQLLKMVSHESDVQFFFTTHSPLVVKELEAESLCHVVSGRLFPFNSVQDIDSIRGPIRTNPEAVFTRKIIVCEGPTEIGICRGLNKQLSDTNNLSFTASGVGIANGNGSNIERVAKAFLAMGYKVAVFMDSDVPSNVPSEDTCQTFRWKEGLNTEQAVFEDITDSGVKNILQILNDAYTEESLDKHLNGERFEAFLVKSQFTQEDRRKLSTLTKNYEGSQKGMGKGAFKMISMGEKLGKAIFEDMPFAALINNKENEHLHDTLKCLMNWAHNKDNVIGD